MNERLFACLCALLLWKRADTAYSLQGLLQLQCYFARNSALGGADKLESCPLEVVQGMGQGTSSQVSTKSMENQLVW